MSTRKAKILATLGPATRETAVIEALLKAGANGVRINMSHGTHDEKAEDIKRARAAAVKLKLPLAVLVDLSGPKIRTRQLKDGIPVTLNAGATFTLTTRDILGDESQVATNYPDLPQVVKPGARLLLDDGAIALVVESTTDTDVFCRVINGGVLGERKGINLPGVSLPIASLTEKDIGDLNWAVAQDVDYIALSFVRRAEDCVHAKDLINKAGGRAPLVAKIEKAEAIEHLDEIIDAADGLMVARGDLGVETSVELVPVYQKRIIEKSMRAGKLVITATQMLQSMVTSPRPTRAEASDVANAVWDGTDALMLSNETAVGQYPIPAVETMCRIIESAEAGKAPESNTVSRWAGRQSGRVSRALCEAAAFAAEEMGTKVTAVLTESGLMARRLSALRPEQRIVALTTSRNVQNELALIWGVESLITPKADSTEAMLKGGEKTLLEAGAVEKGEMIVVMAGRLSGLGLSSSVTLFTVGEPPGTFQQVSPQLNISAGELFELIRPAVLILSALLSTWVFASARKRFTLYVALLWALATFFLPPIVLPLYLITLLVRPGNDSRIQPRWRIAAPLIYGGVVIGSIGLYLYGETRGVDVHLARAAHAKIRGDRARTIAEYRAALREADDPHTHKLLANELNALGYWTEALSEFRLAERGGEPDDLIAFRVGSLLYTLNQPNQAKLEFRRFLDSSLCTQALPDARCETARKLIQME